MDDARLWIRDNCIEKLKGLKDIENFKDFQQVKPALYFGLALIAIVFVSQRVITSLKTKPRRSSARSPDPEKPAGTGVKAPARPYGGMWEVPDCGCP